MATMTTHAGSSKIAELNALLSKYRSPDLRRSLWQLANTALPFFGLLAAMHLIVRAGHPLLALLLTVPAGAFLVRLFIIQHDCGHGSFFKSAWANDAVGAVLGVLTLTPYRYWRQTHAVHHATSGNLDRRGYGDIDTLTVREYAALSRFGRLKYRVYRSAPVLFFAGPAFHFAVYHRLPTIVPADWKQERLSILLTDLTLACLLLIGAKTVGLGAFLLVHLPVCVVAACVGVWLFYVQHQFEDTYWRADGRWEFASAGLEGSSYYKLPAPLQWLTGNIGFHHIHHLNSRVPNYFLPRAMKENPVFQQVTTLTPLESVACARLALWDEDRGRLVGFDAAA